MIYEAVSKLHNVLERKHCGGSSGMRMCGQWFFMAATVCTITQVSCSTSLFGVEPADDFRQIPDDQYQSGPLEYTYIKNLFTVIFPHRSVLLSSWKRLNMFSLCLNTLWMWVYFTGWVRNVRTRLSYKQHVRTVFVFLLLFAMWNVLTNALMLFFVDQVVIVLQGISKRTLNVYECESDCVAV